MKNDYDKIINLEIDIIDDEQSHENGEDAESSTNSKVKKIIKFTPYQKTKKVFTEEEIKDRNCRTIKVINIPIEIPNYQIRKKMAFIPELEIYIFKLSLHIKKKKVYKNYTKAYALEVNNPKYIFIPCNPNNNKPLNYAIVYYENDEDIGITAERNTIFCNRTLYWGTPGEKSCHRCGSFDHLISKCDIEPSAKPRVMNRKQKLKEFRQENNKKFKKGRDASRAVFNKYGEIEENGFYTRIRNLYIQAFITYKKEESLQKLYKGIWSEWIGKHQVLIVPKILLEDEIEKRSINPNNNKPLNYAIVYYENDEDIGITAERNTIFCNRTLYWGTPGEKSCHRCGSFDHLISKCDIEPSAKPRQSNNSNNYSKYNNGNINRYWNKNISRDRNNNVNEKSLDQGIFTQIKQLNENLNKLANDFKKIQQENYRIKSEFYKYKENKSTTSSGKNIKVNQDRSKIALQNENKKRSRVDNEQLEASGSSDIENSLKKQNNEINRFGDALSTMSKNISKIMEYFTSDNNNDVNNFQGIKLLTIRPLQFNMVQLIIVVYVNLSIALSVINQDIFLVKLQSDKEKTNLEILLNNVIYICGSPITPEIHNHYKKFMLDKKSIGKNELLESDDSLKKNLLLYIHFAKLVKVKKKHYNNPSPVNQKSRSNLNNQQIYRQKTSQRLNLSDIIKIASLNIKGITDVKKQFLIDILGEYNITILGLSETNI
ncbi:hypothetical protein GLOIN_2v1780757 [Rhizophagus irregularis DAOM 181602=DAOM 197198]|uniref:CCHC-type domain-containing protein n=1 Tax=Rhizophagus irregularis (strain DAOM 181602 / DAOM 197198 / MUCL 43194) TaxID=747089 RepID=A0A2P4PLK7_RHIID|nr:hypothetical protein GLOIN_2v1780757 [Rhizophagus irregularis DAOM 181602=DAOM 197198]POG66260.1 hypothetical protein GLOIN_2v1780757 [Rhizophagus irregularis DAOM 181602=DAOM 197198]|eukprot:XP_025173126.1 hypothetical protein GLOIN_2v1780757 [Rhizophagus irregularis DAOM 181602=DAOM 197198]